MSRRARTVSYCLNYSSTTSFDQNQSCRQDASFTEECRSYPVRTHLRLLRVSPGLA